MKEKFYPFRVSEDYLSYYFESRSEERTIHKAIELVKIDENTYNLALGDLGDDGSLNDSVVSNNGDMHKVLATVSQIIVTFFGMYRDRRIYFTGSSPSRTRLYRLILSREQANWSEIFEIKGILKGEPFNYQSGVDYEAFVITHKNRDYETKDEKGRYP
ncbi:hypothetical protein J2Y45_006639 [Dyadobacter sp. BE34]|uniref:Uncharacterized protein n=1 Tax=Dyadobacter fermentans TaxID=94254 RepID=A0ABU1R7X0_9BACT|nr:MULTISPECIES: hypothetical protein [Dyadobacter]MDR6809504.1 hypothetical protein [Dyadobacter fermentans]MDR7047239.1 hypothetical protein [Dyadobacter sp. BE242]MDR7201475.1 hypothetical protein [Dyadobacter sp. BE34]MDR7219345.1 hypothetical protein [Dyadobacter sp. BE31]MDR7267111.1 hypothetical protein [Dyadobacter sp. BE32]